ncbi:alpha/beta hydrolase [Umezawaea beigongshangensis]|uniref:alpha/beta hydrolase n=1 Tax=Umezawaea beigongshangensis TaxID=2780383 RepID=UPI0018F27751|nr:alpha/beta hydrolase [Umezawaea beigongshangensis]
MRKRHRSIRVLGTVVVTGALLGFITPVAGGEQAGAGLSRFYDQRITWAPCDPPVPTGFPADFWKEQWSGMDCGTVLVPVDYRDPGGRTLEITATRVKAKNPAERQGVLLTNPGGPGVSGVFFPKGFAGLSAVAESFDVIGFNPRGTRFSKDELRCEVPDRAPDRPSRPTDAQLAVIAEQVRQQEQMCQRAGGDLRKHISTANTARDVDVIRAAMGERRINYYGVSYGTYLGAVYGSLFPGKLDRSVLDSSMHPDWSYYEASRRQAMAIGASVDAWTAWAAQRDGTYGLGRTADEVRATLEKLHGQLERTPVPLDGGPPEVTSVDGDVLDRWIVGVHAPSRPSWDVLAELLVRFREALENGELSPDAAAALEVVARTAEPKTAIGVYEAVTCERDWPTDLNHYYQQMKIFREKYPHGEGAMSAAPTPCTFRSFTPPERPVDVKRRGGRPGLVLQAEFDPATHYEGGPAMARKLRAHLITVVDDGSHGLYVANPCVTAQVDEYLIRGTLPPGESTCAGAPRPEVPADGQPARSDKSAGSLAEQLQALTTRYPKLPLG